MIEDFSRKPAMSDAVLHAAVKALLVSVPLWLLIGAVAWPILHAIV